MVIYGNSYELEIQKKIIRKLRSNNNLSRIESDYNQNKPEVKLLINKSKAKDLGISIKSIGETLETLYGGKKLQHLTNKKNIYNCSTIFI